MLDRICNYEKIGQYTVYTNGTVIPETKVIKALKKYDVFIHISDYRIGEKQRAEFVRILEENGISFTIQSYDYWYDLGTLEKRNYSKEELSQIYRDCGSRFCPTLLNGCIIARERLMVKL